MQDQRPQQDALALSRRVQVEELKHLEACERALAESYRRQPLVPGISSRDLMAIAAQHIEHAAILRGRLVALGGVPIELPDDAWLEGTDGAALIAAERSALATYHDHLTDLDPATARVVRACILREHALTLALLDPSFDPERDEE